MCPMARAWRSFCPPSTPNHPRQNRRRNRPHSNGWWSLLAQSIRCLKTSPSITLNTEPVASSDEAVFADTYFFHAMLNERDSAHARVMEFIASAEVDQLVTTAWVLVEVADGMNRP